MTSSLPTMTRPTLAWSRSYVLHFSDFGEAMGFIMGRLLFSARNDDDVFTLELRLVGHQGVQL